MFLWFVAVIRDQIGEREDRFFATVFFGSGLLFVALLFARRHRREHPRRRGPLPGARRPVGGRDGPDARPLVHPAVRLLDARRRRSSSSRWRTIGLRSRTFPNWFAWTGYLLGVVLLLVVSFWDWIILVLPAWVAVVSLFILRRERARSRLA